MENRLPEISEIVSRRLAELITTSDGGSTFRLLTRMANPSFLPQETEQLLGVQGAVSPWSANPGGVGIWAPKSENGRTVFVRGFKKEWTLWANVDRIEPKAGKKRVLYFGESVARGYFFDPFYSPAAVLQAVLQAASGTCDIEVTDLARTDIGIRPILELIKTSLILEPDAIVVFAGNNWNPYHRLTWTQALQLLEALRESRSWLPIKAYMEERQSNRARLFIESLASLSLGRDLPVFVVIPEFNLVDWRDCGRPLPMLPYDDLIRWLADKESSDQALADGDFEAADEAAARMVSLDGETMPFSLGRLAEGKIRKGELDEARKLLEKARDTALTFPGLEAPRCYSAAQTSLRMNGKRCGISIVDLPHRFRDYLSGELPDRRLFMDYCHLTGEGIRMAMSSVAEAVLNCLGRSVHSWSALIEQTPEPDRQVSARAALLAANHNYNWGQSNDLVRHHCINALRYNPEIARSMSDFIDFHTRSSPSLLCRSFARFTDDNRAMSEYHLNPVRSDKKSKLPMIEVMLDLLKDVYPELREQIERLRRSDHGVTVRGIDLLQNYYSRSTYADPRLTNGAKLGYHKSFNLESSFLLVCAVRSDIKMTITYRVPDECAEGAKVRLLINENCIAELPHTLSWRTVKITVPAANFHEGANSIVVRWPLPLTSWVDRIERTITRIDYDIGGSLHAIYPIYGEIGTFTASRSAETSSSMHVSKQP